MTKEATAAENGEILYTATVTLDGKTYTDTKKVITDKLTVATVNFLSAYGNVMSSADYTNTLSGIAHPTDPSKTDYEFVGWSLDGETVIENIDDCLAELVSDALATETTDDNTITLKPVFKRIEKTVAVTVTNGTGSKEYQVGDVVTVKANKAESGKKFSHWADENGNIKSYNANYSFFVSEDISLTAVYVDDEAVVKAQGTAAISAVNVNKSSKKLSFVSEFTVPTGCKIISAGVVAATKEPTDELTVNTARVVRTGTTTATSYRYTWTVTTKNTSMVVYARAYLVYEDADGNTVTVYGDTVKASVNNGGVF